MGQAGKKPFRVALTVSPLAACQHCQHRSGITPQVPDARQASHRQKQQREEQTCYHGWIGWAQSRDGRISHLHDCCDEGVKQSGVLDG